MRTSRRADELRPLSMTAGVVKPADGSVLVKLGETHVICTASSDRSRRSAHRHCRRRRISQSRSNGCYIVYG